MKTTKTLKIMAGSFALLFLPEPETCAQTLTNAGAAIYISGGATLTVQGSIENTQSGINAPVIENNGIIQVSGNWQNHTSTQYSSTGTLELNGNGAQQFSGTNFYNLTISGSGLKTTSGKSSIQNSLLFTPGINAEILTVPNSDTLALGPAATISETVSGYVTGWLKTTRTVAQNTFYDFGSIGLALNAKGAAVGITTIVRGTGPTAIQTGQGNQGIERVFMISPSNNSNLNADITFYYRKDELNNLPKDELMLFKSTNQGQNWVPVGFTARDTAANTLSMSGINSFSWWTAGSTVSPLPVSWLYFKGKATKEGNVLTWGTATEKNTQSFLIERSETGRDFTQITDIQAAGNSNRILDYVFSDKNSTVFAQKVLYYRLKQTDFDGSFEYSPVVAISRNAPEKGLKALVYPNPFNNSLAIKLTESIAEKQPLTITMHNALGQVIFVQKIKTEKATGIIVISDLGLLPRGMYMVKLESGKDAWVTKAVKE